MSFPTAPEAMTPAWLADKLGQPAGALRGFAAAKVGTGQMCDSFRLTLDWAEGVAAPATIVAKCPSHDEASRNIAALTGTYETGSASVRESEVRSVYVREFADAYKRKKQAKQ